MLKTKKLKSVRFRPSLLAMSIIACGAPSLASAQDVPSENNVEEIVVRGIRASLESAQEIKKNADTVKDVITASDIGALPDKSVTEALQRVPGVTMGRFASAGDSNHFSAEGRGILVRGLDRVHSQVNGRDSFSAGNYTTGGLSYEDIPPELLGSAEVTKNQTADMIAGGIAGTVNLITRKPFDSAERKVFFSFKDSYGELVDKISPAYSALYSDRWDTSAGEFGFLISAAQSQFEARGDGINVTNFYERSATQTEYPALGSTALPGHLNEKLFMPVGVWFRTADSDRDRTGIDAALQWKNSDETMKVTAEYIRSKSTERWRERVLFPTDNSQGFESAFPNVTLDNTRPYSFDSRGFFTSGTITYPWSTGLIVSSRSDSTVNDVQDSSIKFEFTPSDSLKVSVDAQHLNSTTDRENNSLSNRLSQADVSIDLRGKIPKVEFLGTNNNANNTPAGWQGCPPNPTTTDLSNPMGKCNYYQVSAMDTNVDAQGTLDSFSADVKYDIDAEWFKSVSGGAYLSQTDRTTQDDNYANWGSIGNSWSGFASGLAGNPRLYEKFTFGNDYFGGSALGGKNKTFLFPRMSDTAEFNLLAYDTYLLKNNLSQGGGWTNRRNRKAIDGTPTDAKGYLPSETFISKLDRNEAYVRFDFANDSLAMPIKANLGLRYVAMSSDSTGTSLFRKATSTEPTVVAFLNKNFSKEAAFFNGNASAASTISHDYNTILPSLNINLGITDDVITRLAFSKGIYLPLLFDTRNTRDYTPIITTTPITVDATHPITAMTVVPSSPLGGNPLLEPEESNNFDLTTEWYYNKSTSLTFSAFYKDLSNIIRARTTLETVTNPSNGAALTLNTRKMVNEGEGSISGFEVSYQQFYDFLPGAWGGLGSQFNYTYVKPKDLNDKDLGQKSVGGDRNTFRNFTGLQLPSLSENTINATLMYQYSGVEARVAYNWRSEYLITRQDSDSFAPIYSNAAGYMDASVWYTINDNLRVGLEGSNLLDTFTETTTQMNQEGVKTPKTTSSTGRRYALSLRANF